MSKLRKAGARAAPVRNLVPSRLDWSDEKLDQLSAEQLRNLQENLDLQRSLGRVTDEAALEVQARIAVRLPKQRLKARPASAREFVELDARVGKNLRELVARLGEHYHLSDGAASANAIAVIEGQPPAPGVRPKASKSAARTLDAIERSITYRTRDALAGIAFQLRADQPHEAGRYVLVASGDLLETGVPLVDVIVAAEHHGWSPEEQASLRAQTAANFAEVQRWYEAVIGRMATRRESAGPVAT